MDRRFLRRAFGALVIPWNMHTVQYATVTAESCVDSSTGQRHRPNYPQHSMFRSHLYGVACESLRMRVLS